MIENTTPSSEAERAEFRRTLLKVMAMQMVALALLWVLQALYAR